MRRSKRRGIPFTCRACGFEFVKRWRSPRSHLHASPKCPSCGAQDCREWLIGTARRVKLGLFEPRRRVSETTATPWRTIYDAYMRSPEWGKVRALVLSRDRVCRGCACSDGLDVHHLHYRTLGRETGTELITLCRRCHQLEHGGGSLREREHVWKSERVRGDAEIASGTELRTAPFQGESSTNRSGSTKTEAAGLAGRDEARNSPSSQVAIAPT